MLVANRVKGMIRYSVSFQGCDSQYHVRSQSRNFKRGTPRIVDGLILLLCRMRKYQSRSGRAYHLSLITNQKIEFRGNSTRGWLHIADVTQSVNQGWSIFCDLHQKVIESFKMKLRENEDSIETNLQWYATSLHELVSVTASLSIWLFCQPRMPSKDPCSESFSTSIASFIRSSVHQRYFCVRCVGVHSNSISKRGGYYTHQWGLWVMCHPQNTSTPLSVRSRFHVRLSLNHV